ncbi:hypothetical protein ACPCSC_30775 [Streptomyces lavendulocolor]|uniref:hypothetical protein n=1 Tax=Streptomyces lavendulocolor TaxID=67316 RepID=UPI003C2E5723
MMNTSLLTRGRPTLLNTQMITRIAKAVQQGKTRPEVAAQLGVSLSTLQGWITMGRRVRSNGGGSTSGLELLALRLVLELENAERKRDAVAKILSDDELGKTVPAGKAPIGRPALLTEVILEKVTPLCEEGRLREAAAAAGVDKRSVLRWLARGREVHASGGAKTEYERLCGILHARVEAARPPTTSPVVLAAPGAQDEQYVPLPRGAIRATDEKVKLLAAATHEGATREQAAARAGISYRTFARWLALGARVSAKGHAANEHERQCSLLRSLIERADAEKKPPTSAGQSAAADEPGAAEVPASGETVSAATAASAAGERTVCEPVIVIGRRKPGREMLRRMLSTRFGLRPGRTIPYRV